MIPALLLWPLEPKLGHRGELPPPSAHACTCSHAPRAVLLLGVIVGHQLHPSAPSQCLVRAIKGQGWPRGEVRRTGSLGKTEDPWALTCPQPVPVVGRGREHRMNWEDPVPMNQPEPHLGESVLQVGNGKREGQARRG